MNGDIFTEEDEGYQLDIPKEERKLFTTAYDYSVEFLVSLMKESKIKLEVPFQRHFIWKYERRSQLIESIIMNVPIPPLYFAEEKDGTWLIVDGLQRLLSISTFYQNEYALKKLEIVSELETKKYKDLPPKAKNLLDNGLLRVNVIKNNSHPDIKYDIFMRLNKGAVVLNYQELRNCLYRGRLNDRIKKLVSENKDFLEILNLKEPHERFLDVEFVLRYLALTENLKCREEHYYLENYKGRLVKYINDFMHLKKDSLAWEAEEYAKKFDDTIKKVITVFDKDEAFRDLSIESKRLSKPLADVILLSFERIPIAELEREARNIKNLLTNLLRTNLGFQESISQRTSDKDVMHSRINIWFKELKNVISF